MKLNQKIIDASYKLMDTLTKGYLWYTDTPEQRFEITPGSIWLLNPDTKEWILSLKKSGDMWYYYKTYDTFSMYLSMERSDFQSFITIWVEDVLERGVTTMEPTSDTLLEMVEDVLENGKQWN